VQHHVEVRNCWGPAHRTRIPRVGGNRAGSTGSRSYRSVPVRKMIGNWSLTGLRNQSKLSRPVYQSVCSVFRSVFLSGLGNPAPHTPVANVKDTFEIIRFEFFTSNFINRCIKKYCKM
jgi:hypothetical protein